MLRADERALDDQAVGGEAGRRHSRRPPRRRCAARARRRSRRAARHRGIRPDAPRAAVDGHRQRDARRDSRRSRGDGSRRPGPARRARDSRRRSGRRRTNSKRASTPPDELNLLNPLNRLKPSKPVQMTAEEAIAELREKIERMGPVNMMAIEQSKELEERHLFLSTQQQGSRRLDRADQRGDQQDRRDHARALPRSVHRDQRELPDDVLDAVRRRQGRHHAAR